MRRAIFLLSLLLASTALTACSDDDTPDAGDPAAAGERYAEILSRADFGAQLTVIEGDGATWSGAAGDAASADAMTTDHVLLVGSNTKMLTAAITLQLVDEGALALDDAAVTWVPELRDDITVRMLLQHTSGIGEYAEHESMAADGGAGLAQSWTPEQLVELGVAVSDVGPTEQVQYANTNYIALGMVIEAIAERPFDEVLHDRIFAPLGMTSAGLMVGGDPFPATMALGAGGGLGVVTRYHPSVGWAAGSAYMTSADLARFVSAAASGELYGRALRSEQVQPADWAEYDRNGVDGSYGLGVMVFDVQGKRLHGHLGGVDGFTSAALRDSESGLTAVVLTNQDDTLRTIALTLEAMGIDLGM